MRAEIRTALARGSRCSCPLRAASGDPIIRTPTTREQPRVGEAANPPALDAERGVTIVSRCGQDMTPSRDDLTGVDDFIAELSFARRALQRHLGDCTLCGRRFTHPRRPTEFDALGYLVTDTCACRRPSGHDHGCLCEHDIERLV
jgi:hypothetical protein